MAQKCSIGVAYFLPFLIYNIGVLELSAYMKKDVDDRANSIARIEMVDRVRFVCFLEHCNLTLSSVKNHMTWPKLYVEEIRFSPAPPNVLR